MQIALTSSQTGGKPHVGCCLYHRKISIIAHETIAEMITVEIKRFFFIAKNFRIGPTIRSAVEIIPRESSNIFLASHKEIMSPLAEDNMSPLISPFVIIIEINEQKSKLETQPIFSLKAIKLRDKTGKETITPKA